MAKKIYLTEKQLKKVVQHLNEMKMGLLGKTFALSTFILKNDLVGFENEFNKLSDEDKSEALKYFSNPQRIAPQFIEIMKKNCFF